MNLNNIQELKDVAMQRPKWRAMVSALCAVYGPGDDNNNKYCNYLYYNLRLHFINFSLSRPTRIKIKNIKNKIHKYGPGTQVNIGNSLMSGVKKFNIEQDKIVIDKVNDSSDEDSDSGKTK
jgi:hypothetical protein